RFEAGQEPPSELDRPEGAAACRRRLEGRQHASRAPRMRGDECLMISDAAGVDATKAGTPSASRCCAATSLSHPCSTPFRSGSSPIAPRSSSSDVDQPRNLAKSVKVE